MPWCIRGRAALEKSMYMMKGEQAIEQEAMDRI
jgi:hypothetical protein